MAPNKRISVDNFEKTAEIPLNTQVNFVKLVFQFKLFINLFIFAPGSIQVKLGADKT